MENFKDLLKKQSKERIERKVEAAAEAFKMDSNGLSFLRGQFTELEKGIVETIFAPLEMANTIPFVSGFDVNADFITYEMETVVGVAKDIDRMADDYPEVSTFLQEFPHPTSLGGASYSYSIDDSHRPGIQAYNQVQRKAMAAAKAIARWHDGHALSGNPAKNTTGFVNNAHVAVKAVEHGSWTAATSAAHIYADLAKLLNSVTEQSLNAFRPDRLVLPLEAYNLANSTPWTEDPSKTVLEILKARFPGLEVIANVNLAGVGVAGAGRAVAFVNSPDALAYRVVVPYRESNLIDQGFKYQVKCQGKEAGMIWYQPLSAAYMDILAP